MLRGSVRRCVGAPDSPSNDREALRELYVEQLADKSEGVPRRILETLDRQTHETDVANIASAANAELQRTATLSVERLVWDVRESAKQKSDEPEPV